MGVNLKGGTMVACNLIIGQMYDYTDLPMQVSQVGSTTEYIGYDEIGIKYVFFRLGVSMWFTFDHIEI